MSFFWQTYFLCHSSDKRDHKGKYSQVSMTAINPLNAELNPICCLLALLGAHNFLHVSRIRVKLPQNLKKNQERHS